MTTMDSQDGLLRPTGDFLDVLLPPGRSGGGGAVVAEEQYGMHRRQPPNQPTSSYNLLEDYTPQRFHRPQILVCDNADNDNRNGDGKNHVKSAADAVWTSFEPFVTDGIPLKIVGWDSMRDCTLDSSIREGESDDTMLSGNIPDMALGLKISVQCKVKPEADARGSSESEERQEQRMKDIDEALSVASGRGMSDESNLFLGQEDQLTTQMELGDVLHGNYSSDRMQICVAQETIVSSPDSDTASSININSDGSVRKIGGDTDQDSEPLSMLSCWVRAPSYLLPKEKVNVREINVWYAPRVTRTNTHYDGNGNILVVLRGTKTLELTPPGAIRGSPVHSEHANHPAVLRSTEMGGSCNITPSLASELEDTKERCEKSTITASISAGEAIFIPEGWWHRVESSADCLAVNFWFDHATTSVSAVARPSNKHMLPYQAREMARLYVDANFDRVANALLTEAMEDIPGPFLSSKAKRESGSKYKRLNQWNQSMLGCDFEDDQEIINWDDVRRRGFTDDEIRVCYENITREAGKLRKYVDDEPIPRREEPCELTSQMDRLGCYLSIFLVYIRPERDSDRRAAIRLLGNLFPPFDRLLLGERLVAKQKRLFLDIVLRMQVGACWRIAQVWELHKPSSEAEDSYNKFFASCADDSGRRHVLEQVETFKQAVAARLLLGDLMLMNSHEASARDIVEKGK
mmetsp:Transcript_34879/g.76519  ORF Transcript_34879/g.76519 Transcript_34879/m.76519 type:complete len:690 (+) Transcript_34879:62-2131(+)